MLVAIRSVDGKRVAKMMKWGLIRFPGDGGGAGRGYVEELDTCRCR